MRWYRTLTIGSPYFIVGFVDRNLTTPSIGTYVYLGIGALDELSAGMYCFQDAHSFMAQPDEETHEPGYVAIGEESLDMIADKDGLISWLQSAHSTSSPPSLE